MGNMQPVENVVEPWKHAASGECCGTMEICSKYADNGESFMQEKKNDIASQRGKQLDIESVIRDVLRQWWVILLVAVSAAALIGSYLKITYQPEYSTTTTFVVGKSGFSSNSVSDNLNSANVMTERFTQISQSNILRKQVCEKLELDSLDASIAVSTVEASNLMTLTVKAESPRMAYLIIHAVMDSFSELSEELTENIAVRVIQEPAVPLSASNPLNVRSGMKKAALAAAGMMILLFAILSYSKDTIKNQDEMSRKVDGKLLGVVYHEKKYKTFRSWAKRKRYSLRIDNPALSFEYVESVKMLATRVRREMDSRGKKVLMVTSVSENEGKSTVAANLALTLSQEGHSVVLVDCDFRKPAQYKIFELPEDQWKGIDLGVILRNREPVKIKTVGLEKKLKVLFSVKAHKHMMDYEVSEYLRRVLTALKIKADYVIVDSSPMALVAESEIIANLADASLLVVQQDVMEACYINDTIDQLNKTGGEVLGCVYNNVKAGILGRSRVYGHYYGKYGYGYAYSRYENYDKRKQAKSQPQKQEE